ncbi:glycosyltransferase [uncultured Fusobacterium sp.]|uniref:glycosyltransferase n=1 Tax=uncultured Fusobacterium sp. TaxID=159267 RepID=UPI00258BC1FA|nr:glycosyltransferase [uncultured Fusobacterium sp.]
MSLLYIAPTKIEMDRLDGVAKKILGHIRVFAKEFDVMLLYRDNQNVTLYKEKKKIFKYYKKGKSKFDILRVAFKVVKQEKIENCYIRYPNSDPLFLFLLKKLKQRGIRVIVEIPTYPYEEEGKESLRGRIIRFIDAYYRKKIYRYVERIVTYSHDEQIFNIKTIKTVNGIDFEKVKMSKYFPEQKSIHLCGVATFHKIHGYDRVIEGLKIYYENGGARNIIFDIVGYGDNDIAQKYKDMVKKYKIEKHVIFHGRLHGVKLDDIYDKATIGVNSLAIHRQNLKHESTLKTREYAAKGLPILSSSFVDVFTEKDNTKFVCMVSADDSPVDIEKVIEFYDNLVKDMNINVLRSLIRTKSKGICDMNVTLKPIISYFRTGN